MIAFVGAAIHDGIKLHQSKMLLCEDDVVVVSVLIKPCFSPIPDPLGSAC
jgi:hypothetical protein